MPESTPKPSPNQDAWNALLYAGGASLGHELWCSAIRTVAMAVLSGRGLRTSPSTDDDDDPVDLLACEWVDEAIPQVTPLGQLLPASFFQNYQCRHWTEKVSFWEEHREVDDDELFDLNVALECDVVARSKLTKESLESYFHHWKSNLLRRVLFEAKRLNPDQES
jgi:hypothetical protein